MLRQLGQALDILLNQLGRAVVVVQHGEHAVDNGVVCLAEADVDAEDGVDEDEDQVVDEVSDGGAHALLVVEADVPSSGGGLAVVVGEVGGEVWAHHLLALGDGQTSAFLIAAGVEGSHLATAHHLGRDR